MARAHQRMLINRRDARRASRRAMHQMRYGRAINSENPSVSQLAIGIGAARDLMGNKAGVEMGDWAEKQNVLASAGRQISIYQWQRPIIPVESRPLEPARETS